MAATSVVLGTSSPAFAATNPPGEEVNYHPEVFNGGFPVQSAGTIAEARTLSRGVLLRAWRANDDSNNLWFSYGDNLNAFRLDNARSANSPTVVPFGYNQWAIFHRGLDNHIYYGFMDESLHWSGWREVFGQTTSLTPAVTQLGAEHPFELYMTYRGSSSSSMWGTYFNGVWHDSVNLGGATNHSPAVAWNPRSNNGNGALWAAHTGTDGHVYINTQNYGGNWLAWFSVGGNLISGPAIATSNTGNMQMAGRAPDNHVWYQELNSGGGHASGWAQDFDSLTVGWAPFLIAVGGIIYTIATASNDHRGWYKRSFNGGNW
ncbi:hypothetical protein ACFQZ8_01320 [Micromonospora azadirachtae]|uniref:PLL-like beta propeller domain-containing protein n=1 Tax=Micromonospora azadirachtae TaxID=1970735 RepID=A0ABW2ZV85_9ACTN